MQKRILFIFLFTALTAAGYAQKPKLYLKAYGGVHVKKFIYKAENTTEDILTGWQGGFGFRVSYRRLFGEIDFDFIRSSVRIGSDSTELVINTHSFNIPLKGGVILVKTPFFKWYAYTGISNRINTRAEATFLGQYFRFKPTELGLRGYNLDWNLGTQFDVGWLNIDLYYGLGLTNSGKYGIRTNSNEILLNLGFLF